MSPEFITLRDVYLGFVALIATEDYTIYNIGNEISNIAFFKLGVVLSRDQADHILYMLDQRQSLPISGEYPEAKARYILAVQQLETVTVQVR